MDAISILKFIASILTTVTFAMVGWLLKKVYDIDHRLTIIETRYEDHISHE